MRRRLARSSRSLSCPRRRVDVAGARAGAPAVLVRPGAPVRRRPAPRHRHRRDAAGDACVAPARDGQLRRHRADERQDAHDRDGRRALGHAHAPRLDRRRREARGRRGRRRRDGRAERHARGGRAVRPPRHPRHGRPTGLRRPARRSCRWPRRRRRPPGSGPAPSLRRRAAGAGAAAPAPGDARRRAPAPQPAARGRSRAGARRRVRRRDRRSSRSAPTPRADRGACDSRARPRARGRARRAAQRRAAAAPGRAADVVGRRPTSAAGARTRGRPRASSRRGEPSRRSPPLALVCDLAAALLGARLRRCGARRRRPRAAPPTVSASGCSACRRRASWRERSVSRAASYQAVAECRTTPPEDPRRARVAVRERARGTSATWPASACRRTSSPATTG